MSDIIQVQPESLSVKNLTAMGMRVRVRHFRKLKDANLAFMTHENGHMEIQRNRFGSALPLAVIKMLHLTQSVSPTGGHTRVWIDEPGEPTKEGVAVCSTSDAFCYAEGTRIAIAKAFDCYNHEADRKARDERRNIDHANRAMKSKHARQKYLRSKLTVKDGLLYLDGKELHVLDADKMAKEFGFLYAEQLVRELEAKNA